MKTRPYKKWRSAACHPDRQHYAFDLCEPCYRKQHGHRFRSMRPEGRRRYHANLPAGIKKGYRLKKFGITKERFDSLLAEQQGKCAVCKCEPDGRWKSLNVDHDHETGQVRGLLCVRCNRAVGLLKDDPDVAEQLVTYLKAWRKTK